MDFTISLFVGVAACILVIYGLRKALKEFDEAITKLKLTRFADALWWLFPFFFLYVVIELVQKIVQFIDPSISFD